MPARKQTSSQHEDKQFLSHSYTSKDQFVKEYKKFYHGKAKSRDVYLLALTELQNALVAGNIGTFKRLAQVIDYINGIESQTTLKSYRNDSENPIKTTNLVILACKHNKVEILKYLLDNSGILENLSVNVGKDTIAPGDKDENCHDAFYYAVISGNVELVDLLIKKWPGNYFTTRLGELDEVLSKAYGELKLKNVSLSESMEIYVENKLIDLRFFSDPSRQVRVSVKDRINNIKERVNFVLEKIDFLRSKYSNVDKLDETFLFVIRFIAENIHVLKRQLKLTYDRLPWEEIEFCLISFISSLTNEQNCNLTYRVVLNKSKILSYLGHFAKKLEREKYIIDYVDISRLAELPKLKRDLVVAAIIRNNPEFEDLYNDHQQIRDVHSLEKINEYLNLALSTDPKEKEGQLIITRTLQVIGEYLKNTLESPKLSNATSELILMSLPKITRKVIIDLRNSLSHVYSLSERIEIEENTDANFFIGVQNDTKRIYNVITDILYNNKIKLLRTLLQSIMDTESMSEIKEIVKLLKGIELDGMNSNKFKMLENENLKNLVRELSDAIVDQIEYEKNLFTRINDIIRSAEAKTEHIRIDYMIRFTLLKNLSRSLTDTFIDLSDTKSIKHTAAKALENVYLQDEESYNLKEIVELSTNVFRSASSRIQGETLNKMLKSTLEILSVAEIAINDIKWIEKLREKLCDKSSVILPCNQGKSRMTESKFNKQLALKLSELKTILKKDGSGKIIDQVPIYKKDKKLLAVVEMLVLDIMSILGRSEKYLGNNLLFLDDYTPLLTGKCLRNHLAHGNTLMNVLLSDPSLAVILNAEKLITENIVKNVKKIGKSVEDDASKLKHKFDQGFIVITNREEMFAAVEEGDLEKLKICLAKGSDIKARSMNSWSTLHFACRGGSLEVIKYILDQNLDANVKDINGQSPLHIAATHGRQKIVEFLLTKTRVPANDRDNRGKTPLHVAVINGHKTTVEILLKNGADHNTKDDLCFIPLHYAILFDHLDIAKVLLKKEVDVDFNEAVGGYTSLNLAAEHGRLEIVNLLLDRGANVHAKHDNGGMPLHQAAMNGHLEVVKALIRKGADVNATSLDGCTVLHHAAEYGHTEVVDILLKHGADVNIVEKNFNYTPLHQAAKEGHEETVELLLKHKANAKATSTKGTTTLHCAAQSGNSNIVVSLLKHGVDIHARKTNLTTALHFAVECNRKEAVKVLIQSGADINAKATLDATPLYVAAQRGYEEIVDILIENKARMDIGDVNGESPLFTAVRVGKIGVVKLLIKHGAEINTRSHDGFTPLHVAAGKGDRDMVTCLIENNADVNAKDISGITPLHSTVVLGHNDIVDILIRRIAEINSNDSSVGTPLFSRSDFSYLLTLAVEAGHEEIFQTLISNKSNADFHNDDLTPLLTMAILHNRKEIVRVVIENGANVDGDNGEPLLAAALGGNRHDIIDLMVQNNARIDVKDPEGATLLHFAAQNGQKETASLLVAKGADVNAVDDNGVTPLLLAVQNGHPKVVEILIANRANVNVPSMYGTPLHSAAQYDRSDMIDVLLSSGAIIDAKNDQNKTPIDVAVRLGHVQVVKILLQHKNIDINAKDTDDWTLLHIASLQNNLEMVKYLVEKGADIDATNREGSKPIHIATKEGFKNIVEFFLNMGMSVNELGPENQTLLHCAIMKERSEVVSYLIDKGADVNAKDDNGSTPLHFAALLGLKHVVLVLLENGAHYNSVNKVAMRPFEMIIGLMDAERNQQNVGIAVNKDVANMLFSTEKLFEAVKNNDAREVENRLVSGAFINAKNADTETTPLHYAAWKGCDEIVDILLENKANPNAVCSKRFTPLHYAAKFSHSKCVNALLNHGAIYNAVSDTGKTPADFTANKNIKSLMKIIDESFKRVKNGNAQVVNDLNKIADGDTLKAVMNARNRDNKTLIALAASLGNYPFFDCLTRVSQSDVAAHMNEAIALLNQGNYAGSLGIFKRLYEKRRQLFGADNLATLEIQSYIAKVLHRQGNYQEAFDTLDEIFRKQKEMLGLDDKYTLDTRSTMAAVLHNQMKDEEAYSIYEDVYQRQKAILGPNHSDTMTTLSHSALTLDKLGRYDEALKIFKDVYEIDKNTLGENHISTVIAQNNIALVLSSQGKYEESLKIYKDVFEKKKSILGIGHADTLRTLQSIGGILFKDNKKQEALKTYREVLEIQKKHLPQYHPEILNTQFNLANALLDQGKNIAALKVYKECYDQRVSVFGANNPTVVSIAKKIEFINIQLKIGGNDASRVLQHLQTDINVACGKGDVRKVEDLLKNGADVNDSDIDGRTPLHFAVNNQRIDIVNMLLNNDADVTHATHKGNTPLHTAASKNNKDIVEILLRHVGRDKLNDFVNAKTTSGGTTSLHVAAKNGCLEIVQILLNHGATFDIANKDGKMPIDLCKDPIIINLLELVDELFKAVKKGSVEVIDKLKSLKTDEFLVVTNARNKHGHGLLQVAIINKHKNIASVLLEMLKKTEKN